MSCKNVCKLCNRLVISQAVAFTGGNLVITLPAGSYNNGEKYCIVVAQSIPEATTIIMLYRTLLKLKERNGLTDDLKNKIDIFFATGRITEEQYNELMDVNKEGTESGK